LIFSLSTAESNAQIGCYFFDFEISIKKSLKIVKIYFLIFSKKYQNSGLLDTTMSLTLVERLKIDLPQKKQNFMLNF